MTVYLYRRVFEQTLVSLPRQFRLQEAYIDFLEWAYPSDVRGVAKDLMKQPQNRTSLQLFSRFAELEESLGNTKAAQKVCPMSTDTSLALFIFTGLVSISLLCLV